MKTLYGKKKQTFYKGRHKPGKYGDETSTQNFASLRATPEKGRFLGAKNKTEATAEFSEMVSHVVTLAIFGC